jgi:RHS repeat-associated protein
MNGAYYYHSDHLGSAQVVTNHAGAIYERFEYTPYGEVWIAWANSGVAHNEMLPFRFTGKELDEETGLYYYGARYLDPRVSRWLSADPAMGDYLPGAPVSDEARRNNQNLPGQGGVFNLVNLHVYHYAGNNPVKYVDPDGRESSPSIFGSSENFWNFWDSFLGPISAFFGNQNAQQRITQTGQYYLQEFDKTAVAALTTTSEASSKATIFFLAIGQPEAAAASAAVDLAAQALLAARDVVNGDVAKGLNEGTFIVSGLVVGNLVANGVNKLLTIDIDGKKIDYVLNGSRWATVRDNIRRDFGTLNAELLLQIVNEAKKVYDASQEN